MKIVDYCAQNFPKTMEVESWVIGKWVSFNCIRHKLVFQVSWDEFSVQHKKPRSGMGGRRSLCPSCLASLGMRGEANPAFKGANHFQSKLDETFGRGTCVGSGYTVMHAGVTVEHTECGSRVFYSNADKFLRRKFPCNCARIKATVPFARMTEAEKQFVSFCYETMCFTVDQIQSFTGLTRSTVEKTLKATLVWRERNELSASRKRLETLRGSDVSPWALYKKLSGQLSGFIRKAYKDILDPQDKWGYDWHLDHALSKYDGFNKYAKPVDLRLICHPANLRLVPAHENLSKNKKSSLSLKQLKKRVVAFDKKHGAVVFPPNLEYVIERNNNGLIDKDGLRVMALDPGTRNFGVFGGVLHGAKTLHGIKPIVSTMLMNPIASFRDSLNEDIEKFLREFENLLNLVQPDVVVIERFQTRGLLGTTVELVGFMLGLIAGCLSRRDEEHETHTVFRPVMASQWKNAVNRKLDLKAVYEKLGSPKLHHRMDALLMGVYAFPDKDVYSSLTTDRIDALVDYVKTSRY